MLGGFLGRIKFDTCPARAKKLAASAVVLYFIGFRVSVLEYMPRVANDRETFLCARLSVDCCFSSFPLSTPRLWVYFEVLNVLSLVHLLVLSWTTWLAVLFARAMA